MFVDKNSKVFRKYKCQVNVILALIKGRHNIYWKTTKKVKDGIDEAVEKAKIANLKRFKIVLYLK